MRELLKAIYMLVIVAAVIVAVAMAVFEEWLAVACALLVGGVAVAGLVVIRRKPDLVPDFLSKQAKNFFECNGFCFAPSAVVADGQCCLELLFHCRYERPSRARVAFRQVRSFFRRRGIQTIALDIECGPAGFGLARIPWPIPKRYQGTKQTFEVGTSVKYPQGKGKLLRFRQGSVVRQNADFHNAFGAVLTIFGGLAGMIVWSTPASMTVRLPTGVAEEIGDTAPRIESLWQLGDPVPEERETAIAR